MAFICKQIISVTIIGTTIGAIIVLGILAIIANIFPQEKKIDVPAHNWKGEYYANQQLSGHPKIIKDEGNGFINYDWETNGPSEIGSDHFSVRWSRTIKVPADTTYLFCVKSDDGVRLYVDDNLLIDDWKDHYNRTTYGAMLQLCEGNHNITVEYYENSFQANIQVYWKNIEPFYTEHIANAKWGMSDDLIEIEARVAGKIFVSKDEGKPIQYTTHWGYEMPTVVFSTGNSTIEYLFTPRTNKLYRINICQPLPIPLVKWSETVESLAGDIIMTTTGDHSSVSFYAPRSITRLAKSEKYDVLKPYRRQVHIEVQRDFLKHPERYIMDNDGNIQRRIWRYGPGPP